MKPLEQSLLYSFIDTAYLSGRDAADLARQLCDGGSDLIQLRAKGAALDDVRAMAERIAPILLSAGVRFVVNDYPQIALEVDAPLCHLGQEDFFDAGFQTVREAPFFSRTLGIGLSSHAPAQAERAMQAGAAYIAVGPIYATPTKPTARAVGLDYVRWAASHVNIPWFAIGGINLPNLDAVLEAGARRVCVVSAILNARNARQACQTFKDRLLSASQREGRGSLKK